MARWGEGEGKEEAREEDSEEVEMEEEETVEDEVVEEGGGEVEATAGDWGWRRGR